MKPFLPALILVCFLSSAPNLLASESLGFDPEAFGAAAGVISIVLAFVLLVLAVLWMFVPFILWDIRSATRRTAAAVEAMAARPGAQQQQVIHELQKLNQTLGGAQIDRVE